MTSARTRAALKVAKARGVALGNPQQAARNRELARTNAENLRPVLTELKLASAGVQSSSKIRTIRTYFVRRGSVTGTNCAVLTTMGLPSVEVKLLSISRTRKNFSASMGVYLRSELTNDAASGI